MGMVRGSRCGRTTGVGHGPPSRSRSAASGADERCRCRPTTPEVGLVRKRAAAGSTGRVRYPRGVIAGSGAGRHHASMHVSPLPLRADRPIGSVLGETLVGTSLVGMGMWFVLLAVTTPLAASLASSFRSAPEQPLQVIFAWSAVIAAPMVLVVLGTDRLARIVAVIRTARWRRGRRDPFAVLPEGVAVARDVALDDGRDAPTMLVGPFGVAVIHDAPPGEVSSWEDPRELVARDAERVRRWLLTHDVDFVVRIYAALVTPETTLPRTTACAVVTAEQVPAWIASLPRQRSMNPERCARIMGLLHGD